MHMPIRHRLAVRLPLTLAALGLATTPVAAEHRALRMPQSQAILAQASSDELSYHADLGVMGEVELIRERYPDGALKIERQVTLDRDGNYVNHGAWKMFSTKGDVLAEGQYHFGERVGLWTRWHGHSDAPLFNEFPYNQFRAPYMSQAHFTDGQMDGEWLITDANERRMSLIALKAGRRHGTVTTWLANGKVYRQASYDNGVPTGDLLEAKGRNGELERVATYVDGRKLVTSTTHYPGNRQKKTEIMYLGAETIEKSADDFWTVRFAKYTTDGKELRHGVAKAWYPNGRVEQEGIYQFGEKSGVFTYWHENGQVAATGEYRDDQPDGTWVWWHENGQKLAYGRYDHGVLIGEWRWWNEGGKLTKQQIYDGTESAANEPEPAYDVSTLPLGNDPSIF